jgi:hypothetical protein
MAREGVNRKAVYLTLANLQSECVLIVSDFSRNCSCIQ